MSTEPVTCPGCAQRVIPAQGLVCPSCGTSVAEAVFAGHAERIRAITAQINNIPAPGPTSVNGWGTMLLDYRSRGDGTWDATKWFTVAGLPLIPLKRQRVRPVTSEAMISGERYRYERLEEGPPDLKRVLTVYTMVLIGAVPAAFFFIRMDLMRRIVGPGMFGLFVGVVLLAWGGWMLMRIHNGDRAYKQAKKDRALEAPSGGVITVGEQR